jgi:hypothetical protein
MMSRVHSRGLSPEEGSPLRRVAATLRARSALAVPPGFGGLLRIDTARACCIPHPVVGFAKFQAHVAGASEEVLTGEPSPLASHPSKHFPRQQPYRVTAADTFSPFHRPGSPFGARRRARRGLLGWQPTSRCCSTGESVACGPALPPARCSMLPWALIPLKASPLGTVPTALQRRPPSSAPRRSGEHRKESLGRTGLRSPDSSEEGAGHRPAGLALRGEPVRLPDRVLRPRSLRLVRRRPDVRAVRRGALHVRLPGTSGQHRGAVRLSHQASPSRPKSVGVDPDQQQAAKASRFGSKEIGPASPPTTVPPRRRSCRLLHQASPPDSLRQRAETRLWTGPDRDPRRASWGTGVLRDAFRICGFAAVPSKPKPRDWPLCRNQRSGTGATRTGRSLCSRCRNSWRGRAGNRTVPPVDHVAGMLGYWLRELARA